MSGKKVAIYCRLSEEDSNKTSPDQDSQSIENQKNMLVEYAQSQQWEIFSIYSDDDYTGADRNRPQFQRLLADAQDGKFHIVLCKTQSRFTRELELVERYIHGLFPALGIRFVSIVDSADTDNLGNKKSRQINGLVNQWYLEDMSDNIRSVLDSRRKQGLHIGSFALYGYRKDPDQKGHLLVDFPAAQVVHQVFTLFAQGYGKTAIARQLNARGIPNPTEYKRLQGLRYQPPKGKNSTLWKYSAIANMLTNEMYTGKMVQGKYGSVSYKSKRNQPRPKERWIGVDNTHQAIISPQLWHRVQQIIEEKHKPFSGGVVGIFAGKVRCAHCGYTLRSSKNREKYYLQCGSRYTAPDACIGAFISVHSLQERVLAELKSLCHSLLDVQQLHRFIVPLHDSARQRASLTQQIEACQQTLYRHRHYLRTLYEDKVRGVVTEGDFCQLSAQFKAEQHCTQVELQRLEHRLTSLSDQSLDGWLAQYTSPTLLTRDMVEVLIDHIVVHRRQPKDEVAKVEIYWNF